jgi:hypothetical protein
VGCVEGGGGGGCVLHVDISTTTTVAVPTKRERHRIMLESAFVLRTPTNCFLRLTPPDRRAAELHLAVQAVVLPVCDDTIPNCVNGRSPILYMLCRCCLSPGAWDPHHSSQTKSTGHSSHAACSARQAVRSRSSRSSSRQQEQQEQ